MRTHCDLLMQRDDCAATPDARARACRRWPVDVAFRVARIAVARAMIIITLSLAARHPRSAALERCARGVAIHGTQSERADEPALRAFLPVCAFLRTHARARAHARRGPLGDVPKARGASIAPESEVSQRG